MLEPAFVTIAYSEIGSIYTMSESINVQPSAEIGGA